MSGLPPGSVVAVVVTRHRTDTLGDALASLAKQTHPIAHLIVVDNGSRDGTAKWLAATRPTVRVIRTEAALSFARAVNLGLEQARFDDKAFDEAEKALLRLTREVVLDVKASDAAISPSGAPPDCHSTTA